jgi:hypothetical protein
MSTSNIPTDFPIADKVHARFTATVVLPTPPFPLYTPILFLIEDTPEVISFLLWKFSLTCAKRASSEGVNFLLEGMI